MEDLGGSKQADKILKENGVVIYYAKWCPHCQSKKPLWDALATKLDKKGIKSGKLEQKKQSAEDGINGFPTYKVGPSKLEKSSGVEDAADVETLISDLFGKKATGGSRSRRSSKRRRKSHRTFRRNKLF